VSAERIAILLMAWVGYFAVHSLLASNAFKRWMGRRMPALMPAYRLLFNGIALLLLLPLAWLLVVWHDALLWRWPLPLAWLMGGLSLAAVLLFIWSLRFYDGSEFLGLRQWAQRRDDASDAEALVISPLHRCVRHPWYGLGLVLIWSHAMDWTLLLSALAVSGYLLIGSRLEEQRLIALHGERYRRYRRLVPGLIPRPWRCLSEAQARALLASEEGIQ
jgi:protein-S-isoprenylcysteine O-methyltransferase Ste14